jgi:hypothetical protein
MFYFECYHQERIRFQSRELLIRIYRLSRNSSSCPMGTGTHFPGLKRMGHETDHSPSSAEAVLPRLHGVL